MNAQDEIRLLADTATGEEIRAAKTLFWDHVKRLSDMGDVDGFRKRLPNWCAAIDALPETEKFHHVSVVCCDITVDILKRACGVPV